MFLFCYHLRLIKYQAIVRKIKLRNNVVPDLKRVYRGQRYADRFFCQDEVIWNIVLTGHNDHVSIGAFSVFIQVIVLLYSGMHISEFWGLTLSDLDMENRIIRIDHQLQRTSAMEYVIESTQTNAGTRKIPMTEGGAHHFQYLLEVAAITHDIACPLCREKYGNTNGKHQEEEGVPLVKAFLSDSGMTEAQIERVAFLVGHHHTFEEIDGLDWQILIEADYIANATENGYSKENVKGFIQRIMKTESGIRLAHAVFCL